MYTWHILTIGHLSRNKFWGERNLQINENVMRYLVTRIEE